MSQQDDSPVNDWLTLRLGVGALVLYLLAWVVYGVAVWYWLGEHRGQFGDMFGALNAFVSGIAMLGVVAAILLQRDQLRMQAKELELQRVELKATTEALEKQARMMRDEHMFQMLTGILLEYRKTDMMNAIDALWGLYRSAGASNFVSDYERLRIQGSPLHEQRRLVSQFYNWLGGLNDLELLPPAVIHRYWRKSDLQIIPDIILPIEVHLGNAAKPNVSSMKRLYDEAV